MLERFLSGLTLAQVTDTAQAAADATKAAHTSAWILFLMIVVVIVLPFVLGTLIARALRMKDIAAKIGLVLFTVFLAVTPFAFRLMQGRSLKDAVRWGIDLAGGADLIFQVDQAKVKEEGKKVSPEVMQRLIGAIGRRLDPAAQEQITIRQVGSDRIEVIIPGADREVVEQKKKQMTRLGTLEFALLANERKHKDIIREAQTNPDPVIRREGIVVAAWRQVGWVDNKGGIRKQKEVFADSRSETVGREVERNGQKVRELLVVYGPPERRVTGQYLTRAYQAADNSGRPAVGFNFNSAGGNLFYRLTSENAPMADGFKARLSILLDDQIQSAPQINDRIRDTGIIEGDFTVREVNELINVLNAGALEVPLVTEPISELTISPTLGLDVQKKGIWAITVSSLLVYAFMLVYYRFSGIVADLCLTLNLILLIGAMAVIDSAFTLPGLAGIALTIGMAVDSNVLIYERMREELARGSSLRMAIHNGFDKALSAIIDSNVTTLISAVILYIIGTDQIRGFAVTLFIGLVVSLFTVLYFGRIVFQVAERKRWITQLKMMQILGHTNIDFIGKQKICWTGSAIIIIGGLICFFIRGEDNYDVDLSGGTMVTFQFNKPQPIDEVRRKLAEKLPGSISLERLTLEGEAQTGDVGKQFRVRTKEQDMRKVREEVAAALAGNDLKRVTMDYGPLSVIPGAKTPAADKTPDSGIEGPKFAGGHEVKVDFSDQITTTTAHDYLMEELEKLVENKRTKYEQASNLFQFVGTKGEGTTAGQYDVAQFKEMKLEATSTISAADLKTALVAMQKTMASSPAFEQVNTFEGGVAQEMKHKAIFALVASFIAIIIYLWFRFERIVYGLAVILAVVHDCLLVLGMIAVGAYLSQYVPITRYLGLQNFMIDMNMIAAFMTIAGYSLNDTIVVFDRLREIKGKNPNISGDLVNLSVNQTLGRTLLTSWTVFIVVFVLYVWGGESIHGFAYALFVGMITGVYSTVYIASPAVLWIAGRQKTAPSKPPGTATAATAAR